MLKSNLEKKMRAIETIKVSLVFTVSCVGFKYLDFEPFDVLKFEAAFYARRSFTNLHSIRYTAVPRLAWIKSSRPEC